MFFGIAVVFFVSLAAATWADAYAKANAKCDCSEVSK